MTAADLPENAVVSLRPASGTVVVEAARYFAASLAALAIDATLLFASVEGLGLAPWIAGAFSYAIGLVFIYWISVRWVFARRAIVDRRGEFVAFAILGLIGLVLNSTTLFVATRLGIALPIAKVVSAGIGFIANFVSRKFLLFTVKETS